MSAPSLRRRLRASALVLLALVLCASSSRADRRLLVNTVNSGSAAFIYPGEFAAYLDTIQGRGIEVVRIAGQWRQICHQCAPETLDFNTEPALGVYDFSLYFERLDHAIFDQGMRAVVSFNLGGRLATEAIEGGSQPVLPGFLGASDVMHYRNAAGIDQVYSFGSTKTPRFEKASVRSAMLDFATAVVTQFRARYGDQVLYYSFTIAHFGESEYPLVPYPGIADTSPEAESSFRNWLRGHYATPQAVAAAWGHAPPYTSFDQIRILDGNPPPNLGQAPPAYLDFMAYREWALGRFLGELRDRVHQAGGKIFAQFGSVWDVLSSTRGTHGFGPLVQGFDLVLVDDAPTYDHAYSMDYVRTNTPGVAFGNEVDAPCNLGCSSGNLAQCCFAPTFPDFVDIPLGISQMQSQVSLSYQRGARWVDLANWDNFYTEAFGLYATPLANAVSLAALPATNPVAVDTLRISLRELYVHHHDAGWNAGQIAAHAALGGSVTPIAVTLDYDLEPPVLAGIEPNAPPGPVLALSRPHPNPGSGPVECRVALSRPGRVRAGVIDASGRVVRRLTDSWWTAGEGHALRWDGRDARGGAVGAGLFWLVVEAHGSRVSGRFVRLR